MLHMKLASDVHKVVKTLSAKRDIVNIIRHGFGTRAVTFEDNPISKMSAKDLARELDKCKKDRSQHFGLLLYDYIKKADLISDTVLANHLVPMLTEIGRISDAQQVFSSLPQQNDNSWNALIAGYAKSGKLHDAFTMYQKMIKEPSLHVHPTSLVALLKACCKARDLSRGRSIHFDISRAGLIEGNVFIGSALIDMYAKCGEIAQAQKIFMGIPDRNVVCWTSLIGGYVQNGYNEEALDCFKNMQMDGIIPNVVTFICCIKACSNIRDINKGEEKHSDIIKCGYIDQESTIGNALIDMYANCQSLDTAKHVFDSLPVRDTVSWTVLIKGYTENQCSAEALKLFDEMQQYGIRPDAVTFVCSLKACTNVQNLSKGIEMHEKIESQGYLTSNTFIGSSLVDMYAKLGCLDKAQKVFDELLVTNPVSWNALITGYTDDGQAEAALKCLERMLREGITPDSVTYICSLKACGMIQAIGKGKELHDDVKILNLLQKEPAIGNALVDMYIKCNELGIALQVFDTLLFRDVVSWNVLIVGYADSGYGVQVINFVEQMQFEGVFPDPVTLMYTLKACSSMENIDNGLLIHNDIEKRGLLQKNHVLIGSLVDMYTKCGSLDSAQELVDNFSVKSVVAWNALITGYVDQGNAEGALTCYEQMETLGMLPDAITYVCCLKACASIGATEKGKEIHSEIRRHGFEQEVVVGHALIDMYAKCGCIDLAQKAFNRLSIQDVISWTSLISGYVEHGLYEKALDCFDKMQYEAVSPNATTYVSCLKACGKIRDANKGQYLHSQIQKLGLLETDNVLGNTIVDMYAECGLLDTAQNVLDNLPFRDVVLWTSMIAKYADYGCPDKAFQCFKKMQQDGVSPDVVTFVCSLKACGKIGKVQEIHAEIERQGFMEKNHFVCSTLVDMYAKSGFLIKARQVFDRLKVQNTISWNALITGYVNHGQPEEALNCFDEIQLKGVSPDPATYVSCLQACGIVGAIDKGLEIHNDIEAHGWLEKDCIGNTLVDMYVKCSSIENAERVFRSLPARDVVSWTALMRGYSQIGECENVFRVFDNMVTHCIKPDPITFIVVLSACNRRGMFDHSWTYFDAMSNEYGITPQPEHHACIVDLFGRSGQVENAIAAVKKLPDSSNPVVWHSVLGACRNLGNLRIGKEAFKQAMCLDDKDCVGYTFMSQIYADAGVTEEQEAKVE